MLHVSGDLMDTNVCHLETISTFNLIAFIFVEMKGSPRLELEKKNVFLEKKIIRLNWYVQVSGTR